MTDNLQNTPDTTQPKRRGKHFSQALQRPKKKFSPTKLVLTILLVAAPFVIDFVEDRNSEDRIPWSSLNDAQKHNRWLLASSSVDHLKQALASGMPLEYKDSTPMKITLLLFSVVADGTTPEKFQKKSELIRAMAEAGADLDAEYFYWNSPLALNFHRFNSKSDWKKTGDLLIELGADVNGHSGEKNWLLSPLIQVIKNSPDALPSPPKKDADNSSFVDINQHRLDLKYIERGLDPPEPVEKKESFDPLWEEKIRWLVAQGASFDGVEIVNALGTVISEEKSPEVISLLLELGADPDPQGASMITRCLRSSGAYRCRHSTEIVRMLVNAGADVSGAEPCKNPLLAAAQYCCEHNLDIIPMLLSAGAILDASGVAGMKAPILRVARNNEKLQGTHALELIEKAVAAAEIESATVKR